MWQCVLEAYVARLRSHPFSTNAASALVVCGAGDVLAQRAAENVRLPPHAERLALGGFGSAAAQRRLRKSGNNLPFCTKEECIEVYGREVIEAVIRTKRDGDKVSWARVHPPCWWYLSR